MSMIKYLKINSIIASLMLLGAFVLQACDSSDSYDFVGDPNNLVYFNGQGATNGTLPAFKVTHSPAGTFNNIAVKLPVRTTKAPSGSALNVTVVQDNSLVTSYNEKYETSYEVIPDGVISLDNSKLTVLNDTYISKDSIELIVNEAALSLLEKDKSYLLALTIANDGNVVPSSNYGCLYIPINVTYSYARENGGANDMVGSLISNYTGWTYTSAHSTGNIANLWTTSTSQRFAFTADPATVVFDMQTTQKVSGVRIYARSSSYYRLSNVKMALSTDGVTFEEVADLVTNQMAYASNYQYVCLYEGIAARYLRLELDFGTTSTSYWSLVNLGVYAE